MEGIKSKQEISNDEKIETTRSFYRALDVEQEKQILESFTIEQQKEIRSKQKLLSSLAYFIGKDFQIPVELNEPGGGWYWNFKDNEIRIDPKDLLEKPMDYLRFVISHEGGHRRISRTDFIPLEVWRQPGFSFMMNAIEDPRDNNFVAESYPKFREQMALAYDQDLNFEAKAKEKADQKLGYQPRFMQAGFEYIKQWFRETRGQDFEVSIDLPEEVRIVVLKTLESAQDSWLRYPSRQEADKSEELIRKYAELSYQINRDQVWPEFKKLVLADMEDQKMEELLKDMQKNIDKQGEATTEKKGGGDGIKLPQELKDKLTPEEGQSLEEVIKKAIEQARKEREESKEKATTEKEEKAESTPEPSTDGTSQDVEGKQSEEGKPINLDSLSEELKQKIKDYISSLPEEKQIEIKENAEKTLKEFEDMMNEELQGKLTEDPVKKAREESKNESTPNKEYEEKTDQASIGSGERVTEGKVSQKPASIAGMRVFKEKLAGEVNKIENAYDKYRMEVMPLIDKLEADLRAIFLERKTTAWKSGFKIGKRIDVGKRIQEKAKGVSAMESKSWQKRKMPDEKDYAITILADTSGSMFWDEKSKESLKSIIILAEVLNRLGINIEILGFNDEIQEYQIFGQTISKKVRESIGGILNEIEMKKCDVCKFDHNATDIGWATQVASQRLEKQKEENKILITLSDYVIEESPKHPSNKYELSKITKKILGDSSIYIAGLKMGSDGKDVKSYYPNSISEVDANKIAEKLADLIKEVIANPTTF